MHMWTKPKVYIYNQTNQQSQPKLCRRQFE